jgi:hypothetical protein
MCVCVCGGGGWGGVCVCVGGGGRYGAPSHSGYAKACDPMPSNPPITAHRPNLSWYPSVSCCHILLTQEGGQCPLEISICSQRNRIALLHALEQGEVRRGSSCVPYGFQGQGSSPTLLQPVFCPSVSQVSHSAAAALRATRCECVGFAASNSSLHQLVHQGLRASPLCFRYCSRTLGADQPGSSHLAPFGSASGCIGQHIASGNISRVYRPWQPFEQQWACGPPSGMACALGGLDANLAALCGQRCWSAVERWATAHPSYHALSPLGACTMGIESSPHTILDQLMDTSFFSASDAATWQL